MYGAINIAAIYIISLTKSHFAITTLIFINLGYNILSASQYVFDTYNFIGIFVDFVGVIMVLEISLLLWMAASDRFNTKFNGNNDINTINHGFYPRISIPNRGLFWKTKLSQEENSIFTWRWMQRLTKISQMLLKLSRVKVKKKSRLDFFGKKNQKLKSWPRSRETKKVKVKGQGQDLSLTQRINLSKLSQKLSCLPILLDAVKFLPKNNKKKHLTPKFPHKKKNKVIP